MAGIRRRSALSEATTFVHVPLPAAYLQLDDVSGVYQEESVRIRPFDLGQSARAVSEWRVIQTQPADAPGRLMNRTIKPGHARIRQRVSPLPQESTGSRLLTRPPGVPSFRPCVQPE